MPTSVMHLKLSLISIYYFGHQTTVDSSKWAMKDNDVNRHQAHS